MSICRIASGGRKIYRNQCTQNITVSDFGHKGTQCLCFKNENLELISQTREERSSPCCVHRGGKSTSGGGAEKSQSQETQIQTQHRRKKLTQAETQLDRGPRMSCAWLHYLAIPSSRTSKNCKIFLNKQPCSTSSGCLASF